MSKIHYFQQFKPLFNFNLCIIFFRRLGSHTLEVIVSGMYESTPSYKTDPAGI